MQYDVLMRYCCEFEIQQLDKIFRSKIVFDVEKYDIFLLWCDLIFIEGKLNWQYYIFITA